MASATAFVTNEIGFQPISTWLIENGDGVLGFEQGWRFMFFAEGVPAVLVGMPYLKGWLPGITGDFRADMFLVAGFMVLAGVVVLFVGRKGRTPTTSGART